MALKDVLIGLRFTPKISLIRTKSKSLEKSQGQYKRVWGRLSIGAVLYRVNSTFDEALVFHNGRSLLPTKDKEKACSEFNCNRTRLEQFRNRHSQCVR